MPARETQQGCGGGWWSVGSGFGLGSDSAQAIGFGASSQRREISVWRPRQSRRQAEMSRSGRRLVNDGGQPSDELPTGKALFAQIKFLQQFVVLWQVVPLQVIEKLAATAGHLQETAARVKVLAVEAQVLGQMVDPGGEKRDLDFGRAGVIVVGFILGDDFGFGDDGHVIWLVGTSVVELFSSCAARCRRGVNRGASRRHRSNPAEPDQTWRKPATGGFPLTQAVRLQDWGPGRKRKFKADCRVGRCTW